jgi:RAD54-like protein 2
VYVQLLIHISDFLFQVIQEWSKGGGVLLIGYELYRQLSLKRPNKANSKKRRRKHQDDVVDVDEDDKNKALLDG